MKCLFYYSIYVYYMCTLMWRSLRLFTPCSIHKQINTWTTCIRFHIGTQTHFWISGFPQHRLTQKYSFFTRTCSSYYDRTPVENHTIHWHSLQHWQLHCFCYFFSNKISNTHCVSNTFYFADAFNLTFTIYFMYVCYVVQLSNDEGWHLW